MKISPSLREDVFFQSQQQPALTLSDVRTKFAPPQTLGTPESARIALDEQLETDGTYSLLQHSLAMGMGSGMSNFLGYAVLQNIAQNGLIRACIETVSDDMTRNWIELSREGTTDDTDIDSPTDDDSDPFGKSNKQAQADIIRQRIDTIKAEFRRLNLQAVLHDACSKVGYYGGCLLYLDTGARGTDLLNPLNLNPAYSTETREKGFLKAIRVLDPVNCFAGSYNSTEPLASDYYMPKTWWVLGQQVHASRVIRLVANEAPTLFRPAYNFLGIPQSQILWDYVLHFQDNRASVNRLLGKFSTFIFKTAMSDILNGSSESLSVLDTRMAILARNRSNDGILAIDKEAEDVAKIETPLGGVTDILRQNLELIAALNRTPAVKLLGISPSGFNATGESDIRNYYDHVLSQQEKVLRPALQVILDLVQLSLFGERDDMLTFAFNPLSEDDKASIAMTQSTKINSYCALLDRGVISPEEVRQLLIDDPRSGMDNLDPEDVPEQEEGEGDGAGDDSEDGGKNPIEEIMRQQTTNQE